MEMAMTLVVMAVLIQAVVEGIKGALSRWDWVSLGLGAVLCPMAGIDAFALLGVPLALPYVGAVLTGLIVGRGAAAVYDVWRMVKGESKSPEQDTE